MKYLQILSGAFWGARALPHLDGGPGFVPGFFQTSEWCSTAGWWRLGKESIEGSACRNGQGWRLHRPARQWWHTLLLLLSEIEEGFEPPIRWWILLFPYLSPASMSINSKTLDFNSHLDQKGKFKNKNTIDGSGDESEGDETDFDGFRFPHSRSTRVFSASSKDFEGENDGGGDEGEERGCLVGGGWSSSLDPTRRRLMTAFDFDLVFMGSCHRTQTLNLIRTRLNPNQTKDFFFFFTIIWKFVTGINNKKKI